MPEAQIARPWKGESWSMEYRDIYKDMEVRTKGEIYIGVVGPVRTGKSTFIKRFMDLLVLPNMTGEHEKNRAVDELPQSSGGRTITTTEPKFIPKEAAEIILNDETKVKIRLIDCVGYMVEGAAGHMEEDEERMVKTPWFDEEIPFTEAAEVGTGKVIRDHSTIGVVVTCDGSFGEIPRENYIAPEERTVKELKEQGKPFIILLNTTRPYSEEAKTLAQELYEKYGIYTMPVNCEQLKKEDIHNIMEQILYEFPISKIEFFMPKWVEILDKNHPMKADIVEHIKSLAGDVRLIRDFNEKSLQMDSEYIKRCKVDQVSMADGNISVAIDVPEQCYYEMLSEMSGEEISCEYQLISKMKQLSELKTEYEKVRNAMEAVRAKGYGVVTPERSEIVLDKPEIIRHGNKYGVKIKAYSPSLHLIKANVETEIAPIVGTEQQANDLIQYINEAGVDQEGIWETNIFGKTVEQLVNDGINSKITAIGEESQVKLQDTMQKIVNDSNGGMICIII